MKTNFYINGIERQGWLVERIFGTETLLELVTGALTSKSHIQTLIESHPKAGEPRQARLSCEVIF